MMKKRAVVLVLVTLLVTMAGCTSTKKPEEEKVYRQITDMEGVQFEVSEEWQQELDLNTEAMQNKALFMGDDFDGINVAVRLFEKKEEPESTLGIIRMKFPIVIDSALQNQMETMLRKAVVDSMDTLVSDGSRVKEAKLSHTEPFEAGETTGYRSYINITFEKKDKETDEMQQVEGYGQFVLWFYGNDVYGAVLKGEKGTQEKGEEDLRHLMNSLAYQYSEESTYEIPVTAEWVDITEFSQFQFQIPKFWYNGEPLNLQKNSGSYGYRSEELNIPGHIGGSVIGMQQTWNSAITNAEFSEWVSQSETSINTLQKVQIITKDTITVAGKTANRFIYEYGADESRLVAVSVMIRNNRSLYTLNIFGPKANEAAFLRDVQSVLDSIKLK